MSRDLPKYNLDLYSAVATFITVFQSEITRERGVTQRRELEDPKESEEARFYRRNSINECVDSRLGWSEGRQLASILSIGRRVYGTLIRFVSPSASTVLRFGAGGRRANEGVRKRTREGMGTTR